MFRLFLLKLFKHEIHVVLKFFVVLVDLHGVDHFDQGGETLFFLVSLVVDVAYERRV